MRKLLALSLALLMALTMAACSQPAGGESTAPPTTTAGTEPTDAGTEPTAAPGVPGERVARDPIATGDLKIGVILVHDQNSGYDMAHIEGINSAIAALGIQESQVIFKYNIPEDEISYDTAVDLAEQGCHLIISDGYGQQSYMVAAAAEYPDIMFVSCTGDTAALEPINNIINTCPYMFESRYVSGVVAGMKLKQLMDEGKVTDPHIGYVGAFPYAEVVSGYTGFFLGIRSIVPEAYMDVQYTNSWYARADEFEAANSLISKGCVIIGQHADSTGAPSAVQAALDSGKIAYSVGYNIDMLSVAPTGALTSAQNNWAALYTPIIAKVISGEAMPADLALGYADDAVMISPLGESCAPGTAEKVEEVIAGLKDGSIQVFDTKNFTVNGEIVSSFPWQDTDGDFQGDSGEAIVNGVFEESAFRSAPYFALRIDGITELN